VITAPKIEYGVLGPVLIVLAAAVVAVLVEAFFRGVIDMSYKVR